MTVTEAAAEAAHHGAQHGADNLALAAANVAPGYTANNRAGHSAQTGFSAFQFYFPDRLDNAKADHHFLARLFT